MKTGKKIALAALCCALLLYSWGTKHTTFLETSSPDATYEVVFSKQRVFPFLEGVNVSVDVRKNGQPFIDSWVIRSEDLWNDFEDKYPGHVWVDDSVIRLGGSEKSTFDRKGIVSIMNTTTHVIDCFSIQAGYNRFIGFTMNPCQAYTLPFEMTKGLEWIACTVHHPNRDLWCGKNYQTEKQPKQEGTFVIRITDTEVVLENNQFVEYP
jgi:hypothetical protein